MNAKHTPGPWNAIAGKLGFFINRVNQQSIAVTCIDSWQTEEEHEANARLIAAAPELLAALQAFVEQATKVSGFPQAYEPYVGALVVARAAIARAAGE